MAAVSRPDFNEYWVKSPSYQSRNGSKPDLILLHTQEGPGNADSLARFLANPANQVSYHYTVSQAADGGVTVCDVVDTDFASWSVLSANNRAINICFAGSTVNWSREDWMRQSKAIDAAAYIAVQDAKKYGIALKVITPPYNSDPPGISDHRYVTQYLGDGTHVDVGDHFPWDFFKSCVAKYSAVPSGDPVPTPQPPAFQYPSQNELLIQVWEQLFGPRGKGWPQLGGKTLVDAVADLLKKG